MKIENMGLNFNLMNQVDQQIFFLQYSERRSIDLFSPTTMREKKSSSTTKKDKSVKVTSDTLEMLKSLKLI